MGVGGEFFAEFNGVGPAVGHLAQLAHEVVVGGGVEIFLRERVFVSTGDRFGGGLEANRGGCFDGIDVHGKILHFVSRLNGVKL